MSDHKWTIADSTEMDKRKTIANDFYNKILDPEEHPIYFSDEASFYALYFGDLNEAKDLILKYYGFRATDKEFSMPLWQFLDILYAER